MAVGYLDNTDGHISTTDKDALDVTGDIDIISQVAPNTWALGSNQSIVFKNNAYIHRINSGGSLEIVWNPGAGNVSSNKAIPGLVDGTYKWLRTILDVDNGSGVYVTSFQYSDDPQDTPVGSVAWTEAGQNTGAATTSIQATTTELRVGDNAADTQELPGKIFGVWIYNGIPATYTDPPTGTLVANPDPRTDAQGWSTPPATDDQSNSWALVGNIAWVAPTGAEFPDAPTGLTAVPISATQIDLDWDDLSGADAYDVERDGVIIAVDHTLSSYSDTGLDPSTEYGYRVRGKTTA